MTVGNGLTHVYACKTQDNVFISYSSSAVPTVDKLYEAAHLLTAAFGTPNKCFVTHCSNFNNAGLSAETCTACMGGTMPPTSALCSDHVKSCTSIVSQGEPGCTNDCGSAEAYMLNAGFP